MKLYRSLVVVLLAVALGVLGAQWLAQQEPGSTGLVIVRAGGYDYTTSLPAAVLLLLIAAVLVAALWWLFKLPFRTWGRYRKRQGRVRLLDGLRALQGGDWRRGERLLAAAGQDREAGAVALAAAVRAADGRGDAAAAQQWLDALAERDATAHAVLSAERLLDAGRPVDAINTLDVAAAQPLPPRGLLLRTRALAQVGRAGEAYGLLGALRQQAALPEQAFTRLEEELAEASLREATDANLLAERWDGLPKTLRARPAVLAAYAVRAADLRWHDAALRHLDQALDNQWDESLAELYGRLPINHVDARRANVQRWLQQHPASPALLLSSARLARQQGQWEQARDLLHRAIAQGAGSAAWEELGDGLSANGEDAQARRAYANALRANRGEAVEELPGRELHEQILDRAVAEERDAHGIPHLRP